MLPRDLLNLAFHEFEDGHDMLNFSEINRMCNTIFHKHIQIVHEVETFESDKTMYMTNKIGQRHGIYRVWWSNDILRSELNFSHGIAHGFVRRWNYLGQLWYEISYQYNYIHGLYRLWNNNGTLKYKKKYHHGHKK